MSLQQIIDRRLAGKNKSIGNRERFLRRHKDQIREAVKRAVASGLGIGCLSRHAVADALHAGWLVELKTPLPAMRLMPRSMRLPRLLPLPAPRNNASGIRPQTVNKHPCSKLAQFTQCLP